MAVPRRTISFSLLITLALVIAGGVYLYEQQQDEITCTGLGHPLVAVAKTKVPLRKGQPFEPSMVEIEKVPHRFLPPAPLEESRVTARKGAILKVDIERGAMLLESDFE